ncbi:MAG: type II and III secretion system protein family protein [Gemmatimonadales bacterium]
MNRTRGAVCRFGITAMAGAFLAIGHPLVAPRSVLAQQVEPTTVLRVPVGNSSVVMHGAVLDRVSIGNPEIADAVVVSAREVVVNGKTAGTTSLLLWDRAGGRAVYSVRVTADAPMLEREFRTLFPGEDIRARAVGNTVILEGEVEDPRMAQRAVLVAQGLGESVTVLDHIAVPRPSQVLVQVRFAEVSRNALQELGTELLVYDGSDVKSVLGSGSVVNTRGQQQGGGGTGDGGGISDNPFEFTQVVSEAVNFFIFHQPSGLGAFIKMLQQRGLFRSLAEPSLLAASGDSASFLAGGEFPYPVLQGGTSSNAVTIQFKEFGIRLNFKPQITNSGMIRLQVRPEVSQLDFANATQIAGFLIPSLLARRAETTVELADGQTFAIAGLVDNSMAKAVTKVPILGDIPILGYLFKSEEFRQNRTELLVLVTPRLVEPMDEAPELPTGEPDTWQRSDELKIDKAEPYDWKQPWGLQNQGSQP